MCIIVKKPMTINEGNENQSNYYDGENNGIIVMKMAKMKMTVIMK